LVRSSWLAVAGQAGRCRRRQRGRLGGVAATGTSTSESAKAVATANEKWVAGQTPQEPLTAARRSKPGGRLGAQRARNPRPGPALSAWQSTTRKWQKRWIDFHFLSPGISYHSGLLEKNRGLRP